MERLTKCKRCGKTFLSGKRGAIPMYCKDCHILGKVKVASNKMISLRDCLERDKYTCQMCGLTSHNRRKLIVHHKDGNGIRSLSPNHKLDNLVTLCQHCHQVLHLNAMEKHFSILALRKEGYTLQGIGDIFGISRQRVHQIILEEKPK